MQLFLHKQMERLGFKRMYSYAFCWEDRNVIDLAHRIPSLCIHHGMLNQYEADPETMLVLQECAVTRWKESWQNPAYAQTAT